MVTPCQVQYEGWPTFDPRMLRFSRMPVTCYREGTASVAQVQTGMPQIPSFLLDSVVFLYPTESHANSGLPKGGTGFLVYVPTVPGRGVVFVCSCNHVATRSQCEIVRIKSSVTGRVVSVRVASEDWIIDPHSDIAVLPLPPGDYDISPISLDDFVSEADAGKHNVGPGDEVYMLGRFVDLSGDVTNTPAARFGNISTKPVSVYSTTLPCRTPCYLLDMHSRTGFSGSPVFWYRLPYTNLNDLYGTGRQLDTQMRTGFLGMHLGQYSENLTVTVNNDPHATVSGVSGMTVCLPAWKLKEFILTDKTVLEIVKFNTDNDHTLARGFDLETASEPDGNKEDEVLLKMLNTPPEPRK